MKNQKSCFIKERMNKVCVVTVTYGNRFNILKQVLDRITADEHIKKIFIVDNASNIESRKKLQEYPKKGKIFIKHLKENVGSAGGFKKGLELAYKCNDCEYILLLDDDNLPEKKVIPKIFQKLKNIEFNPSKDAIWIFRINHKIFLDYIKNNNPAGMLPTKNSFVGMHFLTIWGKVIKLLKKKMTNKSIKIDNKWGLLHAVPYGGLFFHKSLLKKIGFPREDFFVYVDDYEWTYRITRHGGKIVVFPDLQIEDIIKSWHTKEEKASFFFKIMTTNDEKRVYYAIRNTIVFERENFVDNEIVYKINMFLFLTFLKLYKNRNNKKQYETILKAIKDGLDKKLGKTL